MTELEQTLTFEPKEFSLAQIEKAIRDLRWILPRLPIPKKAERGCTHVGLLKTDEEIMHYKIRYLENEGVLATHEYDSDTAFNK